MATTTTTSKKSTSTTKKAPAKKTTTTTTTPVAKKTATNTTAKVSSTSCSTQVTASPTHQSVISPEEFYRLVAEQAYFIAEARGFAPGNQLLDWLEAEKIVQNKLLT